MYKFQIASLPSIYSAYKKKKNPAGLLLLHYWLRGTNAKPFNHRGIQKKGENPDHEKPHFWP